MKQEPQFIPVHHFEQAVDFYKALEHELSGPFQVEINPLFRGLKNDEFDLIPSSRRLDSTVNLQGDGADYTRNPGLGSLCSFYQQANNLGIELPPVSAIAHKELMGAGFQEKPTLRQNWPSDEVLEVLALAQHHGLKTPLQDWSKSPLVAMRFAASGVLDELYSVIENEDRFRGVASGRLAVWVLLQYQCDDLCTTVCSYPFERYRDLVDGGAYEVEFVYPPTRNNPNIVAQMGCFSFHKMKERHASQKNNPSVSLQEAISNNYRISELVGESFRQGILSKFTLPSPGALELLRILDTHGLNAARLFPSFDGCVSALQERGKLKAVRRKFREILQNH